MAEFSATAEGMRRAPAPPPASVGLRRGAAGGQIDEKLGFRAVPVDRVNRSTPGFGFKAADLVAMVDDAGQEGAYGQKLISRLGHAGPANAFRMGVAGCADDRGETRENDQFAHDAPFPSNPAPFRGLWRDFKDRGDDKRLMIDVSRLSVSMR